MVNINKNHLIAAIYTAACLIHLNSFAETGIDTNIEENLSSTDRSELGVRTIRFYRANKHHQSSRLYVSKAKSNGLGCHNFKRARRIATIVQVGYESCSIYTQKNCDTESALSANHSNQDAYAERLTSGHGWLPKLQSKKDKRGMKLRSWSCQ